MADHAEPLDEYPWPTRNDRFFSDGPDSVDVLAERPSLSHFLWCYSNAVDVLTTPSSDRRLQPHRMIWPILALSRQAVELALKRCIADGTEFLDGTPIFYTHHDLRKLKGSLFRLMNRLDVPTDDDAAQGFFAILDDLAALDPDATVFRYPADRSGAPHKVRAGLADTVSLRDGTQKMLNHLSCLSSVINEQRFSGYSEEASGI